MHVAGSFMPGEFVFTKTAGFRTTLVSLEFVALDFAQDMTKQLSFGSSFNTPDSHKDAFENNVFLDIDPQSFEHFST